MHIAWVGTHDPEFSRNRKLGQLLAMANHDVTVVRRDLWASDRVDQATNIRIGMVMRALVVYSGLAYRLLVSVRPDAYLVSYPGWFDVPLVKVIAVLKRRPVVFDPFISLFDTVIADRSLHPRDSFVARLARVIDRLAIRTADLLIADTPAHMELYEELAGRSVIGFVLPLGADQSVFQPRDDRVSDPRLIAFHGTFVPLQGLATIVEASAILAKKAIRLRIIGDGQEKEVVLSSVKRWGVSPEMTGFVSLHELPDLLSEASVCLGVFGTSEKAGRVVPHKLFECLAMGKPVVTRSGPAIDLMFEPGEIVTVPPGDAAALARAVELLIEDDDYRSAVAAKGLRAFQDRFTDEALATALSNGLASVRDDS